MYFIVRIHSNKKIKIKQSVCFWGDWYCKVCTDPRFLLFTYTYPTSSDLWALGHEVSFAFIGVTLVPFPTRLLLLIPLTQLRWLLANSPFPILCSHSLASGDTTIFVSSWDLLPCTISRVEAEIMLPHLSILSIQVSVRPWPNGGHGDVNEHVEDACLACALRVWHIPVLPGQRGVYSYWGKLKVHVTLLHNTQVFLFQVFFFFFNSLYSFGF